MKTYRSSGALLCAFFFAQSISLFAQGVLAPPGAPAPTMKTLDQVEARTPLAGGTAAVTIVQSGSYYLTGNLSISSVFNGITVGASNVTIDLNGFTLTGPGSGSNTGIFLSSGVSNVTIFNGTIRNWGSHGINALGNPHLRVEKLRVISNGGNGIAADVNAEVLNCVAEANVGVGIRVLDNSIVKDSQATTTSGTNAVGISVGKTGLVTGCLARGNNGNGITTGNNCTLTNCTASDNGSGDGINTGDSCTVTATTSIANGSGFNIQNHCTIIGCTATSNSNVGIYPSDNCIIKDCTAALNVIGIWGGQRCLVVNCAASQNANDGIRLGDLYEVTGCTASTNGTGTVGSGISAGMNGTIRNCVASYNQKHGIISLGEAVVLENHASRNGQDGINTSTGNSSNRIESNHAYFNTGVGIRWTGLGAADLVIRNSCVGIGANNYFPTGGESMAPVQHPETATSPLANLLY